MNSPRIQVLPTDISEKIAAGEVIERPSSVIKELIENSIDAGASSIFVEIEDGGKKRIHVSDNGCGIHASDVSIALERHATSKIKEIEDLWNLHTMGFRGEALPSIATISRFTIESRTDQELGKRLYLEGGKLIREEPAAKLIDESGTSIQVEDLFFNVPARLKFQRSRTGESSVVREMIEHFALVHPHISFTLISEGRKTLEIKSSTELERIAAIFETDPSEIETFESCFENISVRGFLDRNARMHNSKSIYIAANQRIVKDKLLQQAVLTALRPRMMEGEYPRIFIVVDVPPQDIDVNVHPTKTEVRYRKSRDVFQVIHGALQKLAAGNSKPFYQTSFEPKSVEFSMPSAAMAYKNLSTTEFQMSHPELVSTVQYSEKSDFLLQSQPSQYEPPPSLQEPSLQPQRESFFGHYIGQLKNTYLMFQNETGLILIDQHAAHERIQYEKIKKDFFGHGFQPQPLLIALTVKLKPEELELALEQKKIFTKLGFEIELFGEQSLVVRSLPSFLKDKHAIELFHSLLTELKDAQESEFIDLDPTRLSAKVERVLSTLACHSAIRAGQTLSPYEAKNLFVQMETTPSSLNCPHGRPASIHLDFHQIEGLFKRS